MEKAILRSKLPKVVQVTPRERTRLVKYGKLVGDKIKELIQIVTPRTFARWVNGGTARKEPAKKERPRTAEYIRELVLKLARETGWGYTRILGELKKLGTRQVFVSGMTTQPDSIWMSHQARGIAMYFQDQPVKPTYLIRDGDTKFTAEFCAVLESEGMEVKRVGPRAPNMNAYAERWVQTIKTECLDHFVVLGEAHLRHIVSQFVAYYHEDRPHQAKGNLPLVGEPPPETADVIRCEDLVCRKRLGGLLRSYSRRAA